MSHVPAPVPRGATLKACLFDLDGVIIDTARYHYLAWKEIATELGFTFTEEDNERLKGVSRMRSLEICSRLVASLSMMRQKRGWPRKRTGAI